MAAANFALPVMRKDSTIVSMLPATRQEIALARLREWVSMRPFLLLAGTRT
jgi:hypothetical protein